MKYLIILSLFTFPALSQVNSLPESEVIKAINLEPNVGTISCKDRPEEKCHSYEGIQWEAAELVDNEVIDYKRKYNDIKCVPEESLPSETPNEFDIKMSSQKDCDNKFITLECGSNEKIKNYDLLEVYCIENIMKIDGKKLVNSPVKLKTFEDKIKKERKDDKDKNDLKKSIKQRLKNTDVDKITTVKDLKALVKDLIETME